MLQCVNAQNIGVAGLGGLGYCDITKKKEAEKIAREKLVVSTYEGRLKMHNENEGKSMIKLGLK